MGKYLNGGVRRAWHDLVSEIRTWRNHRRGLRHARTYTGKHLDKLHLGCGFNHKPGWLNIDLAPPADLTLDLREALPFPDASFSLIYTEHFLEHVEYPLAARSLLEECLRILKPGGGIRIGVPDSEWPLQEYCGLRNDGYFQLAREVWHPDWCETQLEHINYHFRQDGEHRFAYDFLTLEKILLTAGFNHIQRSNFDPDLDSESRRTGTLYVHAVKP